MLGPGLITGASDDDPSGIATYSQVGAKFKFGLLWTLVLSYPLMVGIQRVSAHIGRVTGKGLSGNMIRFYPLWMAMPLIFIVVVANVINLAADLSAMGDAVHLLIPGPGILWAFVLGILSLVLQVIIPYTKYVSVLKWLTLSLFSYIAVLFAIKVPWSEVMRSSIIPKMSFDRESILALVAVLGTTISPYLFFWQASEEAEEVECHDDEKPLKAAPSQAAYQLKRIRLDTYLGMGVSNLVAFFIIVSVGSTIGLHGAHTIDSSAQAAQALKPVAGNLAFFLFALGIVSTGLLAVPVLAGSAAYAVGEALRWPVGLERKPLHAKGFYGVLCGAILLGLVLNLVHINPIQALYWSAIVNGVAAAPIMAMTMLIASNPAAMGEFVISLKAKILGWTSTVVMALCAFAVLFASRK